MKKDQIEEEALRLFTGKTKKSGVHGVIVREQRKAFIAGANYGAKEGAWIDVRDRLPDLSEVNSFSDNVLTWCKGELHLMCFGLIKGEDGGWVWCKIYDCANMNGDGEFDDNYYPTHWQPLPQAPTKWKEETK